MQMIFPEVFHIVTSFFPFFQEGELSVNDCEVSTASLHESSQHVAPPDTMQHIEPLVVIEHNPLQYHTSSFNTPLKLAYPNASVVIPKVYNSDAAVTNALLSQCRTDVYPIPNCASTPQTMISASHHIGLHVFRRHFLFSISILTKESIQTY